MELGDETEYYTIKSAILNLLDIRLGKRHQRIGLSVGSNHTPRTKLHLDLRDHLTLIGTVLIELSIRAFEH
jgi:hypothetical protein